MLRAIKHGLTNLTNFSGRDARQAFWYYVLFLVILNMAVGFLMAIPMMVTSFETAFRAAQAGMSEDQLALQMSSQIADQMETTIWVGVAANLVTTFLLAASFVRRLHDSNHSGGWAVLAVVAQLAAGVFSIAQVDRMKEMMAISMNPQDLSVYLENQMEFMAYGLVGWIAPIIVIVFGVFKSTDGPNHYGDAPFTA